MAEMNTHAPRYCCQRMSVFLDWIQLIDASAAAPFASQMCFSRSTMAVDTHWVDVAK
jgi:hypothetical protein